jgi:hypothetical protein
MTDRTQTLPTYEGAGTTKRLEAAALAAAELLPWECFLDSAYYDMWCVRQAHNRTFGEGFHLVNGDEAAALCDMLNTRPASQPAPSQDSLEQIPVKAFARHWGQSND